MSGEEEVSPLFLILIGYIVIHGGLLMMFADGTGRIDAALISFTVGFVFVVAVMLAWNIWQSRLGNEWEVLEVPIGVGSILITTPIAVWFITRGVARGS